MEREREKQKEREEREREREREERERGEHLLCRGKMNGIREQKERDGGGPEHLTCPP
jgi:hypothetical protein